MNAILLRIVVSDSLSLIPFIVVDCGESDPFAAIDTKSGWDGSIAAVNFIRRGLKDAPNQLDVPLATFLSSLARSEVVHLNMWSLLDLKYHKSRLPITYGAVSSVLQEKVAKIKADLLPNMK